LSYQGRRFGHRPSFPKPVEIGKEYDVDIKEVSRRGDGVTRIQGFVIFVPNTRPGDHVKIKVTKVGNRFATAEVAKV
jgi:predicted RNA-binding protein with TRAM domain